MKYQDYEIAKDYLVIQAINFTDNERLLKGCIYKRVADIALVVYIVLYDDGREFGSEELSKELIAEWGKGKDFIFEKAFKNTIKSMPPRLYENMWDAMDDEQGKGVFMEEKQILHMAKKSIPLVKTSRNIKGAVAMFYPGVKERIAEKFEGSYYATFTSIHEARVHRVGSIPLRQIKQSLDDINSMFPKEEVLSREVFLYNAKEKTFEVVKI